MKDIKLLVFDIDGTLVDRSKLTVEDSAVDAINRAKENGYDVLVATGRSYFLIHDDVKERVSTDYYVTVNGACLNDSKGNILGDHAFSEDTLLKLISYCKERNYPLGIKYDDHMGVYGDYDTFITKYIGENTSKKIHVIDDNDMNSVHTHKALGVFYYAPQETYEEAQTLIPELYFIPDKRNAVEAVKAGVDKTKSIEDVINRLNLTWDNVMSFGDGNNDVEMLRKAGIGIAMGNAEDKVKVHADFATKSVLDGGIEHALKTYKII